LARHIAIWFFFALIISIMLEPAVRFLRWLRLPKLVAVAAVYLAIFGVLGLMIYLIAPLFLSELNQLSQNIPDYFEKAHPLLKGVGVQTSQSFDEFTANLLVNLKTSSEGVVKAIVAFFGGLASTAFIVTFAFFISLEEKGPERVLSLLVPQKYESYVGRIFEDAQYKVSGWFAGRLLACLFVGAVSFIIFFLLKVKYAFILSLISGVFTFVPFVGPMVTSLVVLLFVGVSDSWLLALYLVVALTVVQEIENKVLTPVLMKRFVNLPPVLVLLSLLFGATIFGFLGMIFSVPVFGIIYEFGREFLEKRKQGELPIA
jgi:predicted PurR-regulated permease PerM